MRGERSQRGEPSTTKSVRTAAWDTKPRKSLLLLRPQPSTALSERQGTQTPSLAPRAPPSRLIPEREQQKVVVFLRERKQGAGHPNTDSARSSQLAPGFDSYRNLLCEIRMSEGPNAGLLSHTGRPIRRPAHRSDLFVRL